MGLMDSMKDAAKGMVGNQISQIAAQHPAASQLLSMFGGGNPEQGLSGLVNSFQQKGLGGIVNSWVSTGANQSINPDQVEQALGPERIQQIAAKLGLDPNAVKGKLAEVLPVIVDKMTPNGKVE